MNRHYISYNTFEESKDKRKVRKVKYTNCFIIKYPQSTQREKLSSFS